MLAGCPVNFRCISTVTVAAVLVDSSGVGDAAKFTVTRNRCRQVALLYVWQYHHFTCAGTIFDDCVGIVDLVRGTGLGVQPWDQPGHHQPLRLPGESWPSYSGRPPVSSIRVNTPEQAASRNDNGARR